MIKPYYEEEGIQMKTERARIIQELDNILREILYIERGKKCEVCGRTTGIGVAHIRRKGRYHRIRWHRVNVLILCWLPCHYHFDTKRDDPRAERVIRYIEKIRGDSFENVKLELAALDKIQPRLTKFELYRKLAGLRMELESLKGGKV